MPAQGVMEAMVAQEVPGAEVQGAQEARGGAGGGTGEGGSSGSSGGVGGGGGGAGGIGSSGFDLFHFVFTFAFGLVLLTLFDWWWDSCKRIHT